MNSQEKTAKELVEKVYNCLKDNDCYVKDSDCSIDFDETKEVAKLLAIDKVGGMIEILDKLHKPEYTTFINKYATELSPADLMDGYELKDYLEEVKSKILQT